MRLTISVQAFVTVVTINNHARRRLTTRVMRRWNFLAGRVLVELGHLGLTISELNSFCLDAQQVPVLGMESPISRSSSNSSGLDVAPTWLSLQFVLLGRSTKTTVSLGELWSTNVYVKGYVRRNALRFFQLFSAFSVEGRAMFITLYGKSRTSVSGARKMCILEWGGPAVHSAHTVMSISFLQAWLEKDFLLTLDSVRRDLDERLKSRLSMVVCCSPTLLTTLFAFCPGRRLGVTRCGTRGSTVFLELPVSVASMSGTMGSRLRYLLKNSPEYRCKC